ncbi:MAG: histone deacetylase [Chthoniobacterales bacterium]|nr:histone deacetylase [Chthoniobacterales bacterium]
MQPLCPYAHSALSPSPAATKEVIVFHDPRCADYHAAGHPERPSRVTTSTEHLRAAHADWEWHQPEEAAEEPLLRAHSAAYIARVRTAQHDFDADTPAYPDIFAHAARASGAACAVAQASLGGNRAFSLMRPPGHHATGGQAMGFCFFNHIAVAALDALERGAARVAIWDFDAHHGNGTEAIVAGNPRIAFASVHQFPGYPGTGTRSLGTIHNFPVPPACPREQHCAVVERALQVLLQFQPDLLLVSAGFDAYAGDPITQMSLEPADFALFGRWLRESGVRAGAILEGGYSDELPRLMEAFLTSWER